MREGGFVCVCPPKTVELDGGHRFRRAFDDRALRQQLQACRFPSAAADVHVLPGGGIAAERLPCGGPSLASLDPLLAVFTGELDNYGYLCKKYGVDILHSQFQHMPLETLQEARPFEEAALLCILYVQLGPALLPKLRGQFAFVLYDASLVRVLAACSPTSDKPLMQARTPAGSLVISTGCSCAPGPCSTNPALPPGCTALLPIGPGMSKYGWQADPKPFATPADQLSQRAAAAAAAAQRALAGIPQPATPRAATARPTNGSTSSSLASTITASVSSEGVAIKKTRRGKRAGRNQRERASMEAARTSGDGARSFSLEMARSSLDLGRSVDQRPDEALWWRRQSTMDARLPAHSPHTPNTLRDAPCWGPATPTSGNHLHPDLLPSASAPPPEHPLPPSVGASWDRACSLRTSDRALPGMLPARAAAAAAAALSGAVHEPNGELHHLRSAAGLLGMATGPWRELLDAAAARLAVSSCSAPSSTPRRSGPPPPQPVWQPGKADAAWQEAAVPAASAQPLLQAVNIKARHAADKVREGASPPALAGLEPQELPCFPSPFGADAAQAPDAADQALPRLRLTRASSAMDDPNVELPVAGHAVAPPAPPAKQRGTSAPPRGRPAPTASAGPATAASQPAKQHDAWGLPATGGTPEDQFAKPRIEPCLCPPLAPGLVPAVPKPPSIGWASPPSTPLPSGDLRGGAALETGGMSRSTSHSALSAALAALKLPAGSSPPPHLCARGRRPRFASHPNLVSMAAIRTAGPEADQLVL